eukprot:comp23674_c0_seq2/m.40525 comp23674_c0_seq2/g.40525  ORF comp23674_c0_seq2/g.40525 comp23674_c0_seq2/m.40525 type:complete len:405 (-) comp23674_c0_seq2:309-1523(-)
MVGMQAAGRHKSTLQKGDYGAVDAEGNAIIVLRATTNKLYEKGTHPYLVVIRVFCRLLMQERDRVDRILPMAVAAGVYEDTIAKSVDLFVRTGDHIVRTTQKAMEKKEFAHTFDLFDVLEHLNGHEFDPVLKGAGKMGGPRLLDLNTNFMLTCSQILQDIEGDMKKNTSKVSADGTVHEITSNTLSLFSRLYEYCDTCEQVLKATEPRTDRDDRTSRFGEYINRVVMTLQQALQNKAQAYSDKVLQTIFLLNNDYFILKTMKAADYYPMLGQLFDRTFQGVVQAQIEAYRLTWSKTLNYLLERPLDPNVKFSKNQKDEIKERFKGFNSEFEEMMARQVKYSVPDEELRSQLRALNIDLLVPAYKEFRNKADKVPFSKNPQKYVKYSVQSLKIHLQKFFDQQQII